MMLDNFVSRRDNQISFWLYIIGLVFGIWGLWYHNSVAILIAIILLALSHILLRRQQKKEKFIGKGLEAYVSISERPKPFRLAGGGAEALVSRPKVAEPLSACDGSREPDVYDFEEELERGR